MSGLARFDKYEGLGNDFVVVDARSEGDVPAMQARAWCDRRFGIGGDGVILVLPPLGRGADARMHVINSDGSVPEMCGNGLRCAVLHLARTRNLDRGELTFETGAGLRQASFERSADAGVVLCDMGLVRPGPEVEVEVDGERLSFTRADAGNPHAISFRAITAEDFQRLGPKVSTHSHFEHGANVEFVRWDGALLHVLVWERGAGPTLACGTGACAAVAVACARGVVAGDAPIRVRLPGGELEVRHSPDSGATTMRGPARHVFAGTLGSP